MIGSAAIVARNPIQPLFFFFFFSLEELLFVCLFACSLVRCLDTGRSHGRLFNQVTDRLTPEASRGTVAGRESQRRSSKRELPADAISNFGPARSSAVDEDEDEAEFVN